MGAPEPATPDITRRQARDVGEGNARLGGRSAPLTGGAGEPPVAELQEVRGELGQKRAARRKPGRQWAVGGACRGGSEGRRGSASVATSERSVGDGEPLGWRRG